MEPNSPRKIQFTVPLLEPHLDPEAAEQIRRRRPTPATLVLSSDQSSPGNQDAAEVDEDRVPNPLLKSGTSMSPRQRKKVSRTTPTMKELQMMVEHHLCKQQQEEEEEPGAKNQEQPSPACCPQGDTDHSHSPGGTCPLAPGLARLGAQGGGLAAPEGKKLSDAAGARSQATTRQDQATEPPGSPAPLTGSTGQKVPTAE